MELWIRSQDKEILTKDCATLQIEYKKINVPSRYDKYVFDINTNYLTLGTYKTKERALEVLAEINSYKDTLERSLFLGMSECRFVSSTYQMPEV